MEYLKLAPDIDSDPAIEDAGWIGARVYELLLKVSAMKDLRGRIPVTLQHPAWLARRWNLKVGDLPIDPETLIAQGLIALFRTGLVRTGDAGEDWVIKGWEKFYRPALTSAERMAAKRLRDACDARDASDDTPQDTTPPTPLHTQTNDVRTAPESQNPVTAMGGMAVPAVTEGASPDRRHVPAVPERPVKSDDAWGSDDFVAWANAKRFEEEGLPPDRKFNEREVSAWWSACLMSGFATRDMRKGFVEFGNDAYWLQRKLPIKAFVSQWEKYVKREVRRAG